MPLQWQNVYVFISSTFNDMHAERDYLIKRVFPDLQEWCDLRKLHLIDIDLRWGVTEADAGSKRNLKLCLQRINDCRPFFVCFFGPAERLGSFDGGNFCRHIPRISGFGKGYAGLSLCCKKREPGHR
jgi:hypothetical protein